MIGAIIGDIVGSVYEFKNIRTKNFPLFVPDCEATDDSIMTLAVAKSILEADGNLDALSRQTVANMILLGNRYPNAGYGGRFAAKTLKEALTMARVTAEVTHNHPEGIKGAEAAAAAVFLAKTKAGMNEIKAYITAHYYPIDFTLDQIRPTYKFDVSCQGSVPQALEAFFESTSYEDAIRSAVSIGGDSDTIACIAGGIAEAYWGVPESIRTEAMRFLDRNQKSLLTAFEEKYPSPPLKEERS